MSKTLDKNTLSRLSPKLAELSNNVLFDDIWGPLGKRKISHVKPVFYTVRI